MPSKYDPETPAKAVRPVLEHRDDYPSEWAAITAVSKRRGMTAETLRSRIRQHQTDDGQRDGVRLHSLIRPMTKMRELLPDLFGRQNAPDGDQSVRIALAFPTLGILRVRSR